MRSIAAFLVLWPLLGWAEDLSTDPFVRDVLAAVPQPAAGEFVTPESVAERFVRAVNSNDVASAIRCFAVRESFRAHEPRPVAEYLAMYSLAEKMPLPSHSDDMAGVMYAFERFRSVWSRLRLLQFVLSHPGTAEKFTTSDPAWGAKLDAVESMRVSVRFIPKVKKVNPLTGVDAISKAMGVEEMRALVLDLSVDGGPPIPEAKGPVTLSVTLMLGRIAKNWRILHGMVT